MTSNAAVPVPENNDALPSMPGDTVADAAAAMLALMGDEDDEDTPGDAPAPDDDAGQDADDEGSPDDAPEGEDAPASEDEPTDTPPDDGLHEVVVDGETLRVPYDELVRGYSRTADYTRKTQATAAREKEIASIRAQYDAKLAAVEELLSGATAEPDWAMLRENSTPEEFADTFAQWSIQKQNREKVQAERARLRAEADAEQAKTFAEYAQRENDLLLRKLPAWKDAAVRTAEQGKLVQYAQTSLGVSAQELAAITDHRVVLALHKAMRYDELAGKARAAKPVPTAAAKPSVKPSTPSAAPTPPETSNQRRLAELRERQRRTGSVQDTAALFFDMLPE